MKKILQRFFGKALILVSLICAFAGKGTAQITMSTANCAITANEVQMDILVTNNSASDLRWNSTVLRLAVPSAMLPAGGTYSFFYIGGSDFPLSFPTNPPSNAFGANFSGTTLTWTTGSTTGYNNTTCSAPLIAGGTTKTIGRFSFKCTNNNFTTGANASFTWATTSSCNLYQACAGSVTGYNQASTLRTLTAPCTLTVPASCNVTGSGVGTAPTCFGGTNGSAVITLAGTGSTGTSYSYTVDGGAIQTATTNPFTITGLSAGSHNITATVNTGGCVATPFTVNVGAGAAFTGSGTGGSVTCNGAADGTASVTVSSGTSGTYKVDGGSSLNYTSNPFTVTGLSAGAHTIVATSAAGCSTGNIAVTVGSVAPLTGSATAGSVSCFGSTNGSTTVTLSASTSGTYSVDGGSAIAYSSNPFTISGLAAGSYSVVATSAAGCVSSVISVTISSPAALTGSATGTTATTCFGSSDGTATITLSAGSTGSYTVDGGSAVNYTSNPFTITGLASGSHTVVATNAAGCSSNLIGVTITAATQVTGSASTTPTTCGSSSTGTATITLSPYNGAGTYTLDGGSPVAYNSNGFTITALSAGPHTVVATRSGCSSADITFTIAGSATFAATYVKTNMSACTGFSDGTITVTPTGGTAPYTYSWTGETGSNHTPFTAGNVSSLTGLNYGYYTVTITDAGGCGTVIIADIHIEKGYLVTITNSGGSSSTCGNTGSIILYGSAGLTPYTYALSPGTAPAGTYQLSNTFTGLAAGSYTAYVKDNAGCVASKPVTVSTVSPLVISPFVRAAGSCTADGSVEIYRSGGTPGYTYSLSVGTAPVGTFQASNVFTGLAAGSYTAYVKDGAGCIGSQPVTVAQGAAIAVTLGKSNSSTCVNDGAISATVTAGGTAPFTYSLALGSAAGGPFQSGNTFSNLAAGNYTVTVKDSKGCTGEASVNVGLNTINVTASVTAATSCSSTNGKIQLFRTGGAGPYTYSLDGNTYQASNTFLNQAPGTYTGYVKDNKTCIGSLPGIVVGPTGCGPTFTGTNTTNVKHSQSTAKVVSAIQAYPNPSQADFTLVLEGYSSKEKVSITVTDLLGRKVYQSEGTGKQQYRFGNGFIAGIYNVQVIQGGDKKSLKLVKE